MAIEEYEESDENISEFSDDSEEDNEIEFSFDKLKLSSQEKPILNDYLSGKYTPRDIWTIRDTIPVKERNKEQKLLVRFDDIVIMQLRAKKLNSNPTLPFGINTNPVDKPPYTTIPLCQPLRKGGDVREDIYCLTEKEKKILLGDNFGYTPDKHADIRFLTNFSDIALPPNQTIIYYHTYKDNVPTPSTLKYVARFYGNFREKPFTLQSLHLDKNTANERKSFPIEDVRKQIISSRSKSAQNRIDIEEKGENKSYLDGISSLDKIRLDGDGTDTFRDAIAIHDAPHSVALFLQQLKIDKTRPKDEQQRQFAIHNITGFVFPYGQEYVKYYTQSPSKLHNGNFPLIITSIAKPVEDLLDENGCPTMFRRWCTRIYKQDESKDFYKSFNLNGITQLLGISRFQSKDRAGIDPALTYSYWAYKESTKTLRISPKNSEKLNSLLLQFQDVAQALKDKKEPVLKFYIPHDAIDYTENVTLPETDSEAKDISITTKKKSATKFVHKNLIKNSIYNSAFVQILNELNVGTLDVEGTPFKYMITPLPKKDKWELTTLYTDPDNRIYQSVPNFEWDEPQQKSFMKDMSVVVHPIIEKFGMHGCMMCPFRSGDYYLGLKENFPDLYKKATQWRQAGGTTKEGSEYYYLFTPTDLKKTLAGGLPEKEKYISDGKPIF